MPDLFKMWRNSPLGQRLVIFASLLVLAVTLALTLLSIQREQDTFRGELESQADLLLEALALNLRDPLYRLQIDELQDVLTIVGDNENVTLLAIYDSKGVLLIDSIEQTPTFSTEVDPLGERLVTTPEDQPTVYDWQADQMMAGRSVMVGNQTVGAVSVGLSTAPLQAKVSELTGRAILIAVVMIALGILSVFLLTRRITGPLEELTTAARTLSEGTLTVRVPQRSEDEVGTLARVFNQMADVLQRRETDLRELNESLEQQVQARTAELTKQNEELRLARQRAEEATQLKSQFLASVSHELRTPLNAIMGFSQLLMMGSGGDLNEKQHNNIERIFNSGQDLLGLINDLLDLSKIEAGRTELINKPFEVKSWTEAIVKQLEGLAKTKGLEFVCEIDPEMPPSVIGDVDRLRQIAVNLIGNAIKFTEKGTINFSVSKQSAELWAITVSDTGIGIPSHAQEFIFEEFRQVDGTTQREYTGTGLGLAIVRSLVVLMGGTVRVQSKVGQGSTFIAQLPLKVAESVS
jgi:signal transduction histidine kinase